MPKSRQEILAEIEEQRAVLDSNAPADEKEFAQAEIFELEQQLQGMETPAEIAEPSVQEVSEHEKPSDVADSGSESGKSNAEIEKATKEAEKELARLIEKFEKVKDAKAIRKLYDKQENDNYHIENTILLAVHYGTPEEEAELKRIYIQNYIDQDGNFGYERRTEIGRLLWGKFLEAEKSSEPKISKAAQSKIDLLRAAIADQRAVIDSNAPEDEKDFARQEIEEFEATIAVLEGEEPSVQVKPAEPKSEPKKRGPKPGSKRAKVVIETGLEQKKQGKKEPKRKVVLDKPMAEIKKPKKKKVALDTDYKNRKNVLPTFDALLVNSKIAKEVSRSFLRKGIKYGIAGHKGIYSIYMIPVSAQLSKAFSVYKEVAEKYDINVSKSTAYTTI